MSLLLPSLDGRVDLKGLLGEGGMGQVHRAWDHTLERAVAIKFVRGADPREAERLLLEARLQARVEHPNVVHVHEVGTLEGRPCILMQLVEGMTLARLSRETPLAVRVELLREAALGLHAAHLQGLVHRDVKPGNILVDTSEGASLHALVSDFGLARDEEGGLTRSGLPAGTLDFMAPEVLLGGGPVDFRVDIYALGATAYALLSGQLPFRRTTQPELQTETSEPSTNPAEDTLLLRRILEEDPAPLLRVPPDLRTIVAKAMEKAPADRYASAEAFADDLGRFQRGEPVLARRAPLAERLLRWSRRNQTAARALSVAALAVVLGIAAAVWTLRKSERAALEAAVLASEAQELHQRMTAETILPLHDLRPARAEVRAALDRATALGISRRSGPAAFLEGRAHQLLGEDAEALEALRRAWELGYRLPEVAYSLAVAEGERFRVERTFAKAVEDPELGARQLQEAERHWRDPALSRFTQLPGRGDALGRLAQVRIALLEERFAEAQTQARALAADKPALIEALELGLSAQTGLVVAAQQRGDLPGAMRSADAALLDGETALATARSSVELRVLLVKLHLSILQLKLPPEDFERHLDLADGLAEGAIRLDPESPRALRVASEVATQRAHHLRDRGQPFTNALERALTLAERATAANPADVEAWDQLAWQALNAAILLMGGLQDVSRPLEQCLAAAQRSRALRPGPPRTLYQAQGLLMRALLAQQRGEADLTDVNGALKLIDEVLAAGTQPIAGSIAKAKGLSMRAKSLGLSGGDPFVDHQAAWAVLDDVRRRFPQSSRVTPASLEILDAWIYQSVLDGRVEVPLDEGEALARARLSADPTDLVNGLMLGGLRMTRGLFAFRRGDRAQGEAWYREGEARVRALIKSPIAPAIHQVLADFAIERAWITRTPSDLAVAEARISEHLRVSPTDPNGRRFLAAALLLRAELAPEDKRGALLTQGLKALEAATASGMTGLPVLVLRGRLKERLKPGSGAEDLAAARRMDPRHYLLQGL